MNFVNESHQCHSCGGAADECPCWLARAFYALPLTLLVSMLLIGGMMVYGRTPAIRGMDAELRQMRTGQQEEVLQQRVCTASPAECGR